MRQFMCKKDKFKTALQRTTVSALLITLLSLCACNPEPRPAPDPDTVRSILTIQSGNYEGFDLSVNGTPVSWDENGVCIFDTAEGADYEIACSAAPAGMIFSDFLIGIDTSFIVAEQVAVNPVRLHVEKTSVFVLPRFSNSASHSVMRREAHIPENGESLPDGIILP
jgi:hypothetical protein